MPLRDHFRSPVKGQKRWGSLHGLWPALMVHRLAPQLPARYRAEPHVSHGAAVEIDMAAFDLGERSGDGLPAGTANGPVTAVWAPPRPTASYAVGLPVQDTFEIRVYDEEDESRLVAAVELVSPRNKDRPESRHDFVIKCASYLQKGISVLIIDVVTSRQQNLHAQLLHLLGLTDASPLPEGVPLYAVAYRPLQEETRLLVDSWVEPLALGVPLPTMPLWLAPQLAVPLELEVTYEETCRDLRIV